jgi:hypothetical protein
MSALTHVVKATNSFFKKMEIQIKIYHYFITIRGKKHIQEHYSMYRHFKHIHCL